MNVAQAIAHLEARFGPPEKTGIEPHEVEAWIASALERTKEWAHSNGHGADLERQDPVPLGAEGEAAIPNDMLAGRITGVNHDSSPFDFVDAGDRGGLMFVFAESFGYYAVDSGKVWTKGPGGASDPLTGELLITGVFNPTLGTLPEKLEPYFVDLLTEIAAERKKLNPIGRDPKPREA